MAGGKWTFYNHVAQLIQNGGLDLDTASIRCILVGSGYTFAATHTTKNDLGANEIATANGYTQNGIALANKACTQVSGVGKWDADDPAWTAAGGSITARRAVLVIDANADGTLATTDLLVAACLLDAADADVVVNSGNQLPIQIHTDGIAKVTLS